jgi:hypothetical protein
MSTTNETPRRPVRVLRNLRIDEVSAVDVGAGKGVKIVLMKRADDEPPLDARSKGPLEKWERAQRREAERREFEEREKLIKGRERGAELFKHYLAKAEVAADRDVSENPRHAPVVEHHASKVADLLVEAGSFPTREQALAHLLHHKDGAALLRRLSKQKDTSAMSDNWTSIAKDHGVIAVAKHVVENGAGSLDEHTFTKLITEHAQREHPDMTPEAAFAKVFTAQTPDGALLRKAHAVTKDLMSLEPVFVGGEDARDVNGAQKAYEQLMNMAEEQRARAPWKTVAQLFSELMQDPKHAELAAKAHQRPGPMTSYPFPR